MYIHIDSDNFNERLDFHYIGLYEDVDKKKLDDAINPMEVLNKGFIRWIDYEDYGDIWLSMPKFIQYEREPVDNIVNKSSKKSQLTLEI